MFCKKCGNQVPEGASFCKNCGTPLTSTKTQKSNTSLGIASNNSSSIINLCPIIILILQLLQIIFHFIPVIEVSIPRYGESETFSVKNGLYEGGFTDINLSIITYILVILVIIAIVYSIINLLGICRFNIFGELIRFSSWGFTAFWFIGTWAYIYQYCMDEQVQAEIIVNVEMTLAGTFYHIINTLLFLALCVSAFLNQKQSKH